MAVRHSSSPKIGRAAKHWTDELLSIQNDDLPDAREINKVRENAERLFSKTDIDAAFDRMAQAITTDLSGENPLLIAVMTGGMVTASMLINRLDFPLQVDYLHLTRYGNSTSGGDIEWIREPPHDLRGRTVLLVDDLLDQGTTLAAAVQRCRDNKAKRVLTAALVVKDLADRPGMQQVDYFGLSTEDRYLFGMGMDYKSYWRNGADLFALAR